MSDKLIPQWSYSSAPSKLSLLIVAPLNAGTSDSDPTANVYDDAVCMFIKGFFEQFAGQSKALAAFEDLAAGDIVNVFTSGGVAKMRKANATDATKPAHGFVKDAVAAGSPGRFFMAGQINDARAGLTPGATYWLDVAGGGVVNAAPSAAGNLEQEIGVALSATELTVAPKAGVQI